MRANLAAATGLLLSGCFVEVPELQEQQAAVTAPGSQRLALATVGQRANLRVFAQVGQTFRGVYEREDPLAWGSGVTWVDYDADGLDDIVASSGFPNDVLVLHNGGRLDVTVAEQRPFDLFLPHAFDADSDGDGDVYMATPGRDFLARSNGTSFEWFAWSDVVDLSAREYGIDSSDLDGDPYPELVMARGPWGVSLYQGGVNGPTRVWSKIAPPPTVFWPPPNRWEPVDADFVDFDADGASEVSVVEQNSQAPDTITIYEWNGVELTESWSTTEFGEPINKIEWLDFDNDGDDDLSTCRYDFSLGNAMLHLYRRNGTSFEELPFTTACFDFAWADYDDDGDPDLASTAFLQGITVFENVGGQLEPVFNAMPSASKLSWGRCGTGPIPCIPLALPSQQ
jgi:hypothetical protein